MSHHRKHHSLREKKTILNVSVTFNVIYVQTPLCHRLRQMKAKNVQSHKMLNSQTLMKLLPHGSSTYQIWANEDSRTALMQHLQVLAKWTY